MNCDVIRGIGGVGKRAPPVGDSRETGAWWTESTSTLLASTRQPRGGHGRQRAEVAPTWRRAGTDARPRWDATRMARMEAEADPTAQIGRGRDQGEAASQRRRGSDARRERQRRPGRTATSDGGAILGSQRRGDRGRGWGGQRGAAARGHGGERSGGGGVRGTAGRRGGAPAMTGERGGVAGLARDLPKVEEGLGGGDMVRGGGNRWPGWGEAVELTGA